MQTLLDEFKEWEPFGQGLALFILLLIACGVLGAAASWVKDLLENVIHAFAPTEATSPEEVRLNHEHEMEQERTDRIRSVLELLENELIKVNEAERLIAAVNGTDPDDVPSDMQYELDKIRGKPA